MAFEIVIKGSITQEDVDNFRKELPDVRIKLSSGISAERTLTIIGTFTKKNIEPIKKCFLRILGEKDTISITITQDNVVITNVSADNLGPVRDFVLDVLDKIKVTS